MSPSLIDHPPPSLTFWFVGVDGAPYGQDEDAVTFYPEDEPAQYASEDFPGFQMNIYVEVAGVANGALVSLFRDSAPVNSQQVVISDGMGSTTFGGTNLPASADTGYVISIEVEGPDGLMTASKTVSKTSWRKTRFSFAL